MRKRIEFYNQVIEAFYNETEKETPVEIAIYDVIGKDPWTGEGMSAADFDGILNEMCPDKDRDLSILLSSNGGSVHQGFSIRNRLSGWPKNIVTTVTGVAASAASWAFSPSNAKLRAFKNSQIFIHDALSSNALTEDEHRDLADNLAKTSNQIAEMYAERSGKSAAEIRQMMKKTKLMTGEEAKSLGFVDEVVEGAPIRNYSGDEINQMQNRIAVIYNSASIAGRGQPTKNTMDKTKIIALLATHGVSMDNSATDEQLQAALTKLLSDTKNQLPADKGDSNAIKAEFDSLKNQIAQLTEANTAARKLRITNEVDALVNSDRIGMDMRDETIDLALGNEKYLDGLKKLPARPPGNAPIGVIPGDASDDVRNVLKGMQQHIITGLANSDKMVSTAVARSQAIGNIYRKERVKVLEFFNATTINIDANLKRVAILNETVRAYARRVLALRMFATVFSNVPLQGTDEIVVQYFPLQTAASVDWNSANGYVFNGTVNQQSKKITVNKRKYQPIDYGSETFRRQPFFNAVILGEMNAEKLAYDALVDILSVITLAKYGAAVKNIAPGAYVSDDITDIQGACNDAHWPDAGRGLLIASELNTALMKDDDYKLAMNIGGTEVIRSGRLPMVSGFQTDWMPSFPENGEKLIGVAVHQSAIGAAFCPVDPVDEVRAALSRYDIATDGATGISMNYRAWGDPDLDRAKQVIETAYGYEELVAAALKRLTKP